MTQAQQPEALRLAEQCDNFDKRAPIAACLRAQHARIQELELNLTHRQEVYTASLEQIVCLQDRIAELEQGKCLHQIAEPAANLTSELADMLERSITGLGHYRNTDRWSEADEEHIHECNALLERFNSSDDEREAAPQAVQAAAPDGWVPCVITYEGQHPEEIAYGPQAMMDRLKKWLDRYFEMRTATAHPAEEVPAPEMNEDGYLPCPFCGSHRVSLSTGQTGDGTPWHYVECESCAGTAEPEKWNERATQPAAQGLEADLTDEQIDEAFNQMPDGAAGFLKSWGYRQFARAVLAAQAKQGGA